MTDLPQVGQKYENDTRWEIIVTKVVKLGRGYQVWHENVFDCPVQGPICTRLKDFSKGYRPSSH